jgi:hypothetical protein
MLLCRTDAKGHFYKECTIIFFLNHQACFFQCCGSGTFFSDSDRDSDLDTDSADIYFGTNHSKVFFQWSTNIFWIQYYEEKFCNCENMCFFSINSGIWHALLLNYSVWIRIRIWIKIFIWIRMILSDSDPQHWFFCLAPDWKIHVELVASAGQMLPEVLIEILSQTHVLDTQRSWGSLLTLQLIVLIRAGHFHYKYRYFDIRYLSDRYRKKYRNIGLKKYRSIVYRITKFHFRYSDTVGIEYR